jgi:cytochrome oxidase Cu insertion factor (SCO1/SenC/PrrC family)
LRGLTGTPEQIKKVARSFRVYSGATSEQESEDYLVDHSIFLYFMGPGKRCPPLFPHTLMSPVRA